ncbi:MAG: hypothetical protein A2186_03210 [Candidatus Levybacteria bacterium RIFOXYA1_FULL_41_10]|nr:MAG: hypothetical protein US02_C0001G0032 [Candidatus Levybacteria bacterium GW2011_GWA2_36_13]KKQ00993.1 MAG: hypothetical protein US07_C0003G0031 [Candidatus Levybacteria bacterium GW2011_GWB1_36_18]KKR15370.1 MAG: hypothetical protein UT44_C0036G0007 [Candidatus Levybacteria bacterium GW2011_GWA1_39_32]KKR72905.1 MAG: hypothetical protein UU15_C0024G0006 [Candidatus Levybacteria bacterium GW2011_GWC2_40_7]OGH20854.1 MAG: hypothetical protein A2695_00510 [Candidatus Levybacteria bacterium 
MRDNRRIFLFDVNHTLINTALYHTQALEVLEKGLKKHTDAKSASYITERYDEIFLLMVAGFLLKTDKEWKEIRGGRTSYLELMKLITKHQEEVKNKWGFIKKWSREVFLKIAAEEIDVDITPQALFELGTVYWDTITRLTEPLEEGKKLLSHLYSKGYPVYLLTSSDGRLTSNNGFFEYDPKLSGSYKKNRMKALSLKGLKFRDVIVGDPEDKPLPGYYERAIKTIEKDMKKKIHISSFVMIGNSFEDDLETLMEMNVGTGVLFKKGSSPMKKKNDIYRVGNLMEVVDLLSL